MYIFADENKNPLYIGKSIDISSRIKQHLENAKNPSSKTNAFVNATKFLTHKKVSSDLEAVILEANLIQTHKPRYNSILKDGKTSSYIIITNKDKPILKIVHGSDIHTYNLDNYDQQVIGPFGSSASAKAVLSQTRKIFGICQNPYNTNNSKCFYYHLDKCPGACIGKIDQKAYEKHLRKIIKFLKGKFSVLQKSLLRQIAKASREKKYEQAQQFKLQYIALHNSLSSAKASLLLKLNHNTSSSQIISQALNYSQLKTDPHRIECYDLAHLQTSAYTGSMAVFLNNEPAISEYRYFKVPKIDGGDPGGLKNIITRRLKHKDWPYPDLIVVDGGIPQLKIVSKIVPKEIPIIALAKKNETIYFLEYGKIKSLSLPIENPVLNLFRSIRDEAHRFANSYHKNLKRKSLTA